MTSETRRLVLGMAASTLIAAMIGGGVFFYRSQDKPAPANVSGIPTVRTPQPPANTISGPPAAEQPVSDPTLDQPPVAVPGRAPAYPGNPRLESAVDGWRKAILTRNRVAIDHLLSAIHHQGEDAAEKAFLDLALGDPEDRVRAFALRALGRMRKPEHFSHYVSLLEKDRSPFVRENAAWSLGELRLPAALPALERAAASDTSDRVRLVSREAIHRIRGS